MLLPELEKTVQSHKNQAYYHSKEKGLFDCENGQFLSKEVVSHRESVSHKESV